MAGKIDIAARYIEFGFSLGISGPDWVQQHGHFVLFIYVAEIAKSGGKNQRNRKIGYWFDSLYKEGHSFLRFLSKRSRE
jgi:hypothetical protein